MAKSTKAKFSYHKEEDVIKGAMDIMEARIARIPEWPTCSVLWAHFFKLRLTDRKSEVFCCAFLDAQYGLIAVEDLFRGTIDRANVYPRDVVRDVLEHNAAFVIFAHNHASGSCVPSPADFRITERLKKALDLIDVIVLDHIVVSGSRYVSFAEEGYLQR